MVRQKLYEELTDVYKDLPPQGPDEAIRYGEEYLAQFSEQQQSRSILQNLVASYGRKYLQSDANSQAHSTIRIRTLQLMNICLSSFPDMQSLFISWLEENSSDDYLRGFATDAECRNILGLTITDLLSEAATALSAGRLSLAEDKFREALSLDKDNDAARLGLSEVLKLSEASSLYRHAVKRYRSGFLLADTLKTFKHIRALNPNFRSTETIIDSIEATVGRLSVVYQILIASLFFAGICGSCVGSENDFAGYLVYIFVILPWCSVLSGRVVGHLFWKLMHAHRFDPFVGAIASLSVGFPVGLWLLQYSSLNDSSFFRPIIGSVLTSAAMVLLVLAATRKGDSDEEL